MTARSVLTTLSTSLVILSTATTLYSQDDSRILHFDGGRVEQRWQINWNGLSGLASTPGAGICGATAVPATATWNPSALSGLSGFTAQVDYLPPLQIGLAGPLDLNHRVAEATDDAMETYRSAETRIVYSQLGAQLKQSDQLAGGFLSAGWKKQRLAFYFYRPFDLRLDALIASLHGQINAKIAVSDKKDDVYFNSYVDGMAVFRATSLITGLAFSHSWTPFCFSGLSIERTRAELHLQGRLNVEGSMLLGGKENAFNDPNDPWHNDLQQAITANYGGESWGLKLGHTQQLSSHWQVAAAVDWRADTRAGGQLNLINNTLPALHLSLDGEDEEEILQPEKLKLSQLTLTETVAYPSHPLLVIRWPSVLRGGVLYRHHRFEAQFNYGVGFSPFAVRYGRDEIGIKPKHSFQLGLSHPWLQVTLGVLLLQKIAHGSEQLGENGSTFVLPQFSVGTRCNLGSAMHLQLTFLSLPLSMLRSSLLIQL